MLSNLKLSLEEARFRKLCDDTQAMSIQGYRSDGTVVYWNEASEKLYGYTADEALGSNLFDLIIPAEMAADVRQAVAWMFEHQQGIPSARLTLKHQDGTDVPVYSSHTVVALPNDEPIMFCMDADLRALDLAEAEVQKLMYFDPLTGLANRNLLLDHLQAAIQTTTKQHKVGAVLLIDVINFHSFNDSLGYESGDSVLRHCAQCISNEARQADTVARIGNDEFVLVLSALSSSFADAATIAEVRASQLLESISRPLNVHHHSLRVNARIGISFFSTQTMDCTILLQQADLALKAVKQQSTSAIGFFDKHMEAAVRHRLELSQALEHAIEQQQLRMVYQPQVNAERQLLSVEALLRWHHPRYGEISPNEFIPIAEASGSILRLGAWVLERCCEQSKLWSNNPKLETLGISINVSPAQFLDPDFVDHVRTILERTQVNPANIRFELTENLMAQNIDFIVQQMQELKQLGISISLDDFGTGYASLAYLTQLPLDELKIDRRFVKTLFKQGEGALLTEMIIGLGRSMNLTIIAEGVETNAQFERLRELGCEVFQGYLFGYPSDTLPDIN
ncbi:putative bifunctional diguanylate cyclase/phosphodiesterase [Pseudidiomarina sediminum]|uniref:putative bifunctional diguanylate cyclase/phosphodiesterase n=1 Tax=Pseudidiomarina sediminum TaxID=431675 RepID=UPI001C97BA8B|nr:GGDEF domain-containing phosphodiesterase [Pseudidiomarina sediminum]MBY6064477.1 EAL domain-containing protein [Pseudidiomarina sediminum]